MIKNFLKINNVFWSEFIVRKIFLASLLAMQFMGLVGSSEVKKPSKLGADVGMFVCS